MAPEEMMRAAGMTADEALGSTDGGREAAATAAPGSEPDSASGGGEGSVGCERLERKCPATFRSRIASGHVLPLSAQQPRAGCQKCFIPATREWTFCITTGAGI